MTAFSARELRVNQLLALGVIALGAVMAALGATALQRELFVPEYAMSVQGMGWTLIISGALWEVLATLRAWRVQGRLIAK